MLSHEIQRARKDTELADFTAIRASIVTKARSMLSRRMMRRRLRHAKGLLVKGELNGCPEAPLAMACAVVASDTRGRRPFLTTIPSLHLRATRCFLLVPVAISALLLATVAAITVTAALLVVVALVIRRSCATCRHQQAYGSPREMLERSRRTRGGMTAYRPLVGRPRWCHSRT